MEQYISKSALVAEIERRKKYYENIQMIKPVYESNIEDFNELLSFINTIEVKEVDLEKELDDLYKRHKVYDDLLIAEHFFELGLKARIDKELVEEVYSHIDSIKDTADRMTSGNFMHNRAAIKFSANTIVKVLELMGLKAQKGE